MRDYDPVLVSMVKELVTQRVPSELAVLADVQPITVPFGYTYLGDRYYMTPDIRENEVDIRMLVKQCEWCEGKGTDFTWMTRSKTGERYKFFYPDEHKKCDACDGSKYFYKSNGKRVPISVTNQIEVRGALESLETL